MKNRESSCAAVHGVAESGMEMTRQRNNNNTEENGNHGSFLKGSDLIRLSFAKILLENELERS